jgi:transcriptional regulator with XRE-family HTH domain
MEQQNSGLKRSTVVSRLLEERSARESYVRATLNVLIPSQIRALRLDEGWTQLRLGQEADMKQARISAAETPGAVNFNLETLVRFAAAFRVGLQVSFVPFSKMLDWENKFSQDTFTVRRIDEDKAFTEPAGASSSDFLTSDILSGAGASNNRPPGLLEAGMLNNQHQLSGGAHAA